MAAADVGRILERHRRHPCHTPLIVGLVPAGAPQWAFRLAGGVYYQLPFYREMLLRREISPGEYVTEVNSDVRSQRSLQIVGGADFNFRAFGRPFKFSAEAYYKALSKINPYEVENLTVTYLGRNAASGHVAGLDFKLFGQFVAGSDSWISFGLMDTRETLEGKSVRDPTTAAIICRFISPILFPVCLG